MREAAEALDDFEMKTRHVTVAGRPSTGESPRTRQAALLIREHPRGVRTAIKNTRHAAGTAKSKQFAAPAGRCEGLGIAGKGAGRAAKDVARHLIEQHYQCQCAFGSFPSGARPRLPGHGLLRSPGAPQRQLGVLRNRSTVVQPRGIVVWPNQKSKHARARSGKGLLMSDGEPCSRLARNSISTDGLRPGCASMRRLIARRSDPSNVVPRA